MSEEILQQLVRMVATNNSQQVEMKEMFIRQQGLLDQVDKRLSHVENGVREIKSFMYRIERLERQLDKTVSRLDRMEIDLEMIHKENN